MCSLRAFFYYLSQKKFSEYIFFFFFADFGWAAPRTGARAYELKGDASWKNNFSRNRISMKNPSNSATVGLCCHGIPEKIFLTLLENFSCLLFVDTRFLKFKNGLYEGRPKHYNNFKSVIFFVILASDSYG